MRPLYDTPEHRADEASMAARIAAAWKCDLPRRPDRDTVDWTLLGRKGRVTRAYMECKNRQTYTWARLDALGGVLCSHRQWCAARELTREDGVPFVFVVADRCEPALVLSSR